MTPVDNFFPCPPQTPTRTSLSPYATMGRRKTSPSSINERNMRRAITAVNRGQTYRAAAAAHCLKTITLHRRVTGPPLKRAIKMTLTMKEEALIVPFLQTFAHRGIPLSQNHLKEAIAIYVNRMDPTRRLLLPFRCGIPGRAFLRGFRNRHKATLSFSKPLRQESNRFAAVNSEVLTTHFAIPEKLIVENNLDASRIFNLDESGVTPEKDIYGVTSSKRLMPRSGCKDLRTPEFRNLNRVTIMPVISASGSCAPPLFVFKAIKLPYRSVLKHECVSQRKRLFRAFRRDRWLLHGKSMEGSIPQGFLNGPIRLLITLNH